MEKKTSNAKNLESDEVTEIQRRVEEKVSADEALSGEQLSGELSKDRTHMSEHRTRMSEHRTDMSDTRTVLSYQRTSLAYERTLMAWIRTATSMISFGFTIYKFLEEGTRSNEEKLITPRVVGMIMIGFGFVGLLFAQIQHQIAYKKLKEDYPDVQKSLTSILGIMILIFGLLLFFVTLLRQ